MYKWLKDRELNWIIENKSKKSSIKLLHEPRGDLKGFIPHIPTTYQMISEIRASTCQTGNQEEETVTGLRHDICQAT